MSPTPEERAREQIDHQLRQAGWVIQDRDQLNLYAGPGVAVREFPLQTGYADYLLFVNQQAAGVIEAKPAGTTLSGVADQSGAYTVGLPDNIPHVELPLPFKYEASGVETFFTDLRDPEPRSRSLFHFHRPETLAGWAAAPETLRARLRRLPPLITDNLWKAQVEAITNLEDSLARDKPRALIQMATGSGKTYTAITAVYRLIKFAGVRRVLFLVDRSNLGRQALKEFQGYRTPDDGRLFTELYNVQRLTSNALNPVNQVCITTIQRMYSMLQGEPEFDPLNEEVSLYQAAPAAGPNNQPLPVVYNPSLPPETFDVIIIDECHRSIYNLWRQVLEYFDAYLIGLTATPASHTFAFFHQNLVMEYSRRRAVADGVNVDGLVYQIRTRITEQGGRVEAGFTVKQVDKKTRAQRWQTLDDDLAYSANDLDREVVAEDQIRTVIRAFKEKLFTEIFPGRKEVPKTLIFAKDDNHAENITRIVREEFDRGDQFCKKITYRVTGTDPEQLIQDFRTAYFPRIAVTVDMVATGTDIKPLEILLFMRMVKSANFFEQMLGRGTRVIQPTDLRAVTPGKVIKDHFVIIDTVGVVDQPKTDTQTLERKRGLSFEKLLEGVALGAYDEDALSSLAGRLARLENLLSSPDAEEVAQQFSALAETLPPSRWPVFSAAPRNLNEATHRLLDALDPDRIEVLAEARGAHRGADGNLPPEALQQAQHSLMAEAALPFAASPGLRNTLVTLHQRSEITIDDLSLDTVTAAGFDSAATEQARATVESFRAYIEEHKDRITALQLIFERPHDSRRLTFEQVRELAEQLRQPPRVWTTERLWQAYAALEKDRVRGLSAPRVLADLVALVRHAVELDAELVPFPERTAARYRDWLAAQQAAGREFSAEQRWWLDRIAEHIGVNLSMGLDDFDYGAFFERGGRLGARRALGPELKDLVEALNENLV